MPMVRRICGRLTFFSGCGYPVKGYPDVFVSYGPHYRDSEVGPNIMVFDDRYVDFPDRIRFIRINIFG